MEDSRIIAIRKQDINLAHLAFVDLMDKTEGYLNKDAKEHPEVYKAMNVSDLEKQSEKAIKVACEGTPFRESEVLLISGQRFPDIIAEKYYGVEVKSTKYDHWKSTGSSIVESTRDLNVEDIYMLFGKMGGEIPQFKCRPYEDVLCDIAVTHSPRYLIDMQLEKKDTIFSKMKIPYNDFRKSSDSIDKVRRYYGDKARAEGKKEMPWWITSENIDSTSSFNIKLWSSLDKKEQRDLIIKSFILFPKILNPKDRRRTKYDEVALWFCSYCQVVNSHIRDSYSAGGVTDNINGIDLIKPVPKVFENIVKFAGEVKCLLDSNDEELYTLIKEYNPALLKNENMYEAWLDILDKYAEEYNVPLRRCIKGNPTFN